MIDRATVDRIYAAADIVDIVSDFVTLKRAGVNYKACCPFHDEDTPSFIVSPAKGLFKCFGCGKGGNAVTFVMEHEKMTYPEALKFVGKKYGIEVEDREVSEEEKQRNDDRESMMVVNSWAFDYFKQQLTNTDEGLSVGKSYLRQRGFTDATIARFGLGYCPSKGDQMTQAALAAGYKEQFLTGTGLSIKRETGGWYDRFCGRVIFPIHSISGRVIAFGGRVMRKDDRTAKYLNSPESPVYSKTNSLYGLYFAKGAITKQNYCILVEGYTDVIQMHQKGIENVVASSGTSLTTEQIRLIGRFTRNITVIYDGDPAGIKASLRGIDMILREGMNVRVVLLPAPEDPDSFARNHTAEEVRNYIDTHAEDFISFKANLLMKEAEGDPIRKAELIQDIVQSISEVPDKIQRSVFIKECARTMDISEQVLLDEVARRRLLGVDKGAVEFVNNFRRGRAFAQQSAEPVEQILGHVQPGSDVREVEKELVSCLLLYGHQNFEMRESGGSRLLLNVADTIFRSIEIPPYTPVYRTIYEEYHRQWEERGVGVKVPEDIFISYDDPEVCNQTVDMLTADSNYSLSNIWKRHDIYHNSEEEILSERIPRLIYLYQFKALDNTVEELKQQLTKEGITDEEVDAILGQITDINKARTDLAGRINRLIV